MYVSWSDIIAAAATFIVGLLGLFLVFIKVVNWRRRRKQRGREAQSGGNDVK